MNEFSHFAVHSVNIVGVKGRTGHSQVSNVMSSLNFFSPHFDNNKCLVTRGSGGISMTPQWYFRRSAIIVSQISTPMSCGDKDARRLDGRNAQFFFFFF